MLARARFQTETPNVIDAGEDAPSRPSRRGPDRVNLNSGSDDTRSFDDNATADSTILDSISFPEDTRQHMYTTSNKGHISKGIRIDYTLEADDEPDASPAFPDYGDGGASDSYGFPRSVNSGDEELQLRGKTPPLPLLPSQSTQKRTSSINPQENERSVREARLFAAAMLNESDRRINLHNERNLSLRQESSSSLHQMMTKAASLGGGGSSRRFYDEISLEEEAMIIRPHDPKRFRRRMMCRILAALIAILAVVLFCIFAIDAIQSRGTNESSSGSNSGPSIDNPERLDDVIDFLFRNEISTARDLYDETTPQYHAAHWLALEDSEQLTVPSLHEDPSAGGLRDSHTFRFIQRYVLAVMYYGLNGEQWNQQHDFVTGIHECSWFDPAKGSDDDTYALGVTCTPNMQVRDLLLASNNLVGTLPPEIQHLSKLHFFDLHNNTLSGSLPTELQGLSHLDLLNLNFNQMTGSIPHWLGDSLNRLQALGLSQNLFTGSIPSTLATALAPRLKSLSLDGNMLTGDITSLERLRYLKYLYLNDNDLVGQVDRGFLADMNFLEEVDISGNRISSGVPRYLFTMDKLRVLDLSNNRLTGFLPPDLVSTSPLEFLSLRNNSMTGRIPGSLIPDLSNLYHLDLSFNQLTGDLPDVIGESMTRLSYLFLGDNSLELHGGTIPDHLQLLTNLRELSLGNLILEGSIPTWIENFEHLRLLDLSENQLNGTVNLDFTKLKHLRYLLLHDNKLSGSLPASLKSLENLQVLSLHLNGIQDETTVPSICSSVDVVELITVDCKKVDCPCCNQCCESENCFEGVVWETLEHGDGKWEENFTRSDYGFNPHITLTGAMFEGTIGCGDNC